MYYRLAVIIVLLCFQVQLQAKQLVMLTWPEYLPESVINQFEAEFDTQLTLMYFESDEKKDYLLNGNRNQDYDIVVSSYFRAQHYASRGWLQEVTIKNVPNLKHLLPIWNDKYTQSNQYCVPYLWGSLGIIYNSAQISQPITSWHDFFNVELPSTQKIKLISDSRDVIGSALLALGYSVNSPTRKQIQQAGKLIYKNIANISTFGAIELSERSELVKGEVSMAMAYNGDALQLIALNDQLKFVQPTDGNQLWLDCLTVTEQAKNTKAVHQFINFIHRPKIAAQISQSLNYATTNKSALPYIPDILKNNRVVYLSKSELTNGTFHQTLSPELERTFQTLYSQLNFEVMNKKQ